MWYGYESSMLWSASADELEGGMLLNCMQYESGQQRPIDVVLSVLQYTLIESQEEKNFVAGSDGDEANGWITNTSTFSEEGKNYPDFILFIKRLNDGSFCNKI